MKLTLSRQAVILVAVPLAFELLFVACLSLLLLQFDSARERAAHARELSAHLNSLMGQLYERGATAIFSGFGEDKKFAGRYEGTTSRLEAEIAALQNLTNDYPAERAAIAHIVDIEKGFCRTVAHTKEYLNSGEKENAGKSWKEAQVYQDQLFQIIESTVRQQLDADSSGKTAQSDSLVQIYRTLAIGILSNILIVGLLAEFFNRRTKTRLKLLMDNTIRVARDQPLVPATDGDDEIAHLDYFLGNMAEELLEARRRERAVIDNTADVICSIDPHGRVTAINQACQIVWGYLPEELFGNRISQIICSEDAKATADSLREIIETRSEARLENRVRAHDGKLIEMSWSVRWSDRDSLLFCVAHDNSEQKQIEGMKRQFVEMVSSDLQTPLINIQKVHNRFLDNAFGMLSQDGRLRLQSLQGEIRRMITLVNGLINLNQVDAGRLNLNLAPTTIDAVLNEAVLSIKSHADKKGVVVQIQDHADVAITADRDRLIQVLVNLLANAVKFSPEGAIVYITVRETSESVVLNVTDNGRGVPEHMQEAIFERFKQVEASDSSKLGGAGLGLAICKAIITQHGGKIGVSSQPGKGSTFWISLPKIQVSGRG